MTPVVDAELERVDLGRQQRVEPQDALARLDPSVAPLEEIDRPLLDAVIRQVTDDHLVCDSPDASCSLPVAAGTLGRIDPQSLQEDPLRVNACRDQGVALDGRLNEHARRRAVGQRLERPLHLRLGEPLERLPVIDLKVIIGAVGSRPYAEHRNPHQPADLHALEHLLDLFGVVLGRLAPDVGVGARTQAAGEIPPHVELDVGIAHQQRLCIGIDRDELDALEADFDHPVDGVHTTAADSDNLDHREVVLRSSHVASPLARVPFAPLRPGHNSHPQVEAYSYVNLSTKQNARGGFHHHIADTPGNP